MTPDAITWRTADWYRRPPGMHHDDWLVWQLYIRTPDAARYSYAYDLELRIDHAPADVTDAALREMWERNNARRIDAVGRIDNVYTLFEARRNAGWSAIAQLQGYAMLAPMFMPELAGAELVLVTEHIADELHALAARNGVRVWLPPGRG